MESLGAWAWLAALVTGAAHAGFAYARARRRAAEKAPLAALALVGGAWALAWLLGFGVLPELASRGWLPGARGPGICERSPGSGCAACVASADQTGTPRDACYEGSVERWALELAAFGPAHRAAARRALGE